MEIFERMGWYGFYAVGTLYLTNSVADGGLGFSSSIGLIVYNRVVATATRESS